MGNFITEIKIIKEKQMENLEIRNTKLIMKNSQDNLTYKLEIVEERINLKMDKNTLFNLTGSDC